jgi:hypothetical protein
MSGINYGFVNYTAAKLSPFANNIIQRMSSDMRFDSLKTDVDTLKTIYADFQAATGIATKGGTDRKEVRDASIKSLTGQLRVVGLKVELLADGDTQLILAAGFPVRQERNATPSVENLIKPTGLRAFKKEDDPSGLVRLEWNPVPGSVNYAVEHQVQGSEPWRNGLYSTRIGAVITGLTPGTFVNFVVYAIGRHDKKSEKSSSVGIWVS